jgi:hypothetical protein
MKLSFYPWSQGTHKKLGGCTVGFSNSKWAVVLEQHARKISIHSCRELRAVTFMVWMIPTTSLKRFRLQRINNTILINTRIDFQNVWALSHSSSKPRGIFQERASALEKQDDQSWNLLKKTSAFENTKETNKMAGEVTDKMNKSQEAKDPRCSKSRNIDHEPKTSVLFYRKSKEVISGRTKYSS